MTLSGEREREIRNCLWKNGEEREESEHGSFTCWRMEIELVSRFDSGKTQRVSTLSDSGQQFSRTNEGESTVIV